MIAIAEISGADSIAAAVRFAEQNPGARIVPTYVHTGTEFGDFSQIESNVTFLRHELPHHGARIEGHLRHAEDPALWRALSGRPARALVELFGAYLPCVPCHLYLHLMRVPTALALGAEVVISGERETHGERTKANQLPGVLDAYEAVLSHAGLTMALPLRSVAKTEEIEEILGARWSGGSPQLECVLKGNESSLDDDPVRELPSGFVADYVRPAGIAVVDEIARGGRDWDGVVHEVLAGIRDSRA